MGIFLRFASSIPSDTNTIAVNQTFKDGDLLIYEEKNFALGFFKPGSSSYRYLGIWFHKVSLQTVVWVANRNNPINGSSGVVSVKEGNLVLYNNNESENPVWSTNVSMEATDTCVAKLLDSGNVVLFDKKNN